MTKSERIVRVVKTEDGMYVIENQMGKGQPRRWTAIRPLETAEQAKKIAKKAAAEWGVRFEAA
jgi:hypothetical protein